MSRPAPGQTGDLKRLTHGSIRDSVARAMRLVVITAEGPPHPQYVELLSGRDVVLSRDQVRGFVPESRRPANLERWPRWLLRGDDELIVYRGKA
jgi:hypothetical protein